MKFRELQNQEPERIAKLPHYKGLPVMFTTLVEDGIPNFKSTNENVWVAKRDGLCSICGEKLDYWIAFMVGEEEAESRLVYENPNHEECLRHAFNICPWLFFSKAKYTDAEDIKLSNYVAFNAHPNRDNSMQRPPKLGIYITNRYENKIIKGKGFDGKAYRVCKVGKPARIEWIEGR